MRTYGTIRTDFWHHTAINQSIIHGYPVVSCVCHDKRPYNPIGLLSIAYGLHCRRLKLESGTG